MGNILEKKLDEKAENGNKNRERNYMYIKTIYIY